MIFYGDRTSVCGRTKKDWQEAPDDNVQAIARWPRTGPRKWRAVEDRDIWTGEESYDPFGWGVKLGKKIADDEYYRIWREAFYGKCDTCSNIS